VGKTTVIARLLARPGFARSITSTTRAPRQGEVEGQDYLFLDRATFERDLAAGRFLESAEVHGNLYGTPRDRVQAILDRGDVCILNIDVQGARSLRSSGLPVVTAFLLPPSMEELERRLAQRGTEGPTEVARRLQIAKKEMESVGEYDFALENNDVNATVRTLEEFLLRTRRECR
jgi:guanylate kinase